MYNRLTDGATGTLTVAMLTVTTLIGSTLMAASGQAQMAIAPQSQGAVFLKTQPVGISTADPNTGDRAAQLNQVADSMQTRTPAPPSGILSKLSPTDKPAAIDPLDFFRVPGMNGSVKMPLSQSK